MDNQHGHQPRGLRHRIALLTYFSLTLALFAAATTLRFAPAAYILYSSIVSSLILGAVLRRLPMVDFSQPSWRGQKAVLTSVLLLGIITIMGLNFPGFQGAFFLRYFPLGAALGALGFCAEA